MREVIDTSVVNVSLPHIAANLAASVYEETARSIWSMRRRSQFVQSLVGKPWTVGCLYDNVLDTSAVGLDAAAT